MTEIAWDQIGVGVAAILGLVYLARTQRQAQNDVLRLQRYVLEYLGSHLSAMTTAQREVASSLDRVASQLDRVEGRLQDLAEHVGAHETRS